MAGNKISTKTKGKEDKNKTNTKQSGEETEEPDFSVLRKPIPTSITGFGQARKIFDLATEELKDLLSNECDLLYECKVCRNIFRSLANFISHKRVYCKEKFNSSLHGHFIKTTSTINELVKIKQLEQGYLESLRENDRNEDKNTIENDERIPLSKDLTAIMEKIVNTKGVIDKRTDGPQLSLQKIPNSSVAVFQNLDTGEGRNDEMKVQVKELDKILSKDVAVLQSDGHFKVESSIPESENVIQISDDEDNDENNTLKCKICDMQFSTRKTLKFHMKYKHVESRLVYPCPDCLEIFSTSWSVYRHLFKVHRKTAAQIRRLRESIQAKAFRMNNPPAFYEKRKNNMKPVPVQKISEEERLDQENQAWMDNMEGDGEVPRCGGCGRTFERRAALAAHTHTCQSRVRALARHARAETKRIEIQIRRDYHKGPPINSHLPLNATDANENKVSKEERLANKVDKGEKLDKGDAKCFEDVDKEDGETTMDVSEDDQKSNDTTESVQKTGDTKQTPEVFNVRLPFAQQIEHSNFIAFKQRIASEININELLCKICDVPCNNISELHSHVAEHLKWVRYACKLCNYKHYLFDKLPEHVKVVHKLKGDKDFYFSTVKAVPGPEALALSLSSDKVNINETSPDSRRPSRCSSDSSRLSDDSSSSSTRIEVGSRKRKLYQNKGSSKRKRDFTTKVTEENTIPDKEITMKVGENDSSSIKAIEENSSDMDDNDEKLVKRVVEDTSSVASRRPVRRKAKPKNEDFEYDLSNLLKMEAQGYRDSQLQSNQTKSNQAKKTKQLETQSNYDTANKECNGALIALSNKAVDKSRAHMKTNYTTNISQKELRSQNIFVRPLIPKSLPKSDKISPKKDCNDERKETLSPNMDCKTIKIPAEEPTVNVDNVKLSMNELSDSLTEAKDSCKDENITKTENISKDHSIAKDLPIGDDQTMGKEQTTEDKSMSKDQNPNNNQNKDKDQNNTSNTSGENRTKTKLNMVPIKFRRQSLEVMKNPIINRNITEFTKSGLKTKILVIKPINRNRDGKQTSTPLKFQTIKLKDPNKISSIDDKPSDQVVVVKVPKVDCTATRSVPDKYNISNNKSLTTDMQDSHKDENTSATTPEIKNNQTEILVNKDTSEISNCIEDESNCNNISNSESVTKGIVCSDYNSKHVDIDNTDFVIDSETSENINTIVS